MQGDMNLVPKLPDVKQGAPWPTFLLDLPARKAISAGKVPAIRLSVSMPVERLRPAVGVSSSPAGTKPPAIPRPQSSPQIGVSGRALGRPDPPTIPLTYGPEQSGGQQLRQTAGPSVAPLPVASGVQVYGAEGPNGPGLPAQRALPINSPTVGALHHTGPVVYGPEGAGAAPTPISALRGWSASMTPPRPMGQRRGLGGWIAAQRTDRLAGYALVAALLTALLSLIAGIPAVILALSALGRPDIRTGAARPKAIAALVLAAVFMLVEVVFVAPRL